MFFDEESAAAPTAPPLFLRRLSHSWTHSGISFEGTNSWGAVTLIHINASECLQGNFRDGHVHL
jgi:hypothetical protein